MTDQPRKISNFHLTRLVHEGVKSEIYEARYTQAGGVVQSAAVKVLKPMQACIGHELRAFLRELGWARDLRHSLFPRLIEAGEHGGNYFLATEFVDGWTLAEVLRSLAVLQIPMPCQVSLTIAHQIVDGVRSVHEYEEEGQLLGVVHLGVMPDNIILRKTGAAVLVDFGMAMAAASGETVEPTDGGEAYQAPERLRMLPVDRRADVYSVGRVLENLVQTMAPHDVGEDLPALIARACHTHVEERYPSMQDLLTEIELVAHNRGIELSCASCAQFTTEIFGQSQGRTDPRARRPQSVAPINMQSEGLETAFAPPMSDEQKRELSHAKFHQQATVGGEALAAQGQAPELESTFPSASAPSFAPSFAPSASQAAIHSGQETVVGGVISTGGDELPAPSHARGQEAAFHGVGEPELGNDEPTERTLAPEPVPAPASRMPGPRFVDEHMAVTAMGAPQMMAALAASEEATEVLDTGTLAKKGFPEELIPTLAYETAPSDEEDDDETVVGGVPPKP